MRRRGRVYTVHFERAAFFSEAPMQTAVRVKEENIFTLTRRAAEFGVALPLEQAKPAQQQEQKFRHVWLDDVTLPAEAPYIVKRLIDKETLVLIYGPSSTGKTFFTLDLLAHVAAGMPWRGRRVKQQLVVYVAAEAGASILKRAWAWRNETLGDAANSIPLAIITRAPDLLRGTDREDLIAQLRAISSERGLPVGVVCVDTLSQAMPGGKEDAEAFSRMTEFSNIISAELQATTIYVHHSGKNEDLGARGHSNLTNGAPHTKIQISEGLAEVVKQRDGKSGDKFPFKLLDVDLGLDADGESRGTCIIEATDAVPVEKKPKKLSDGDKFGLDALHAAIETSGERMPGTSAIPQGVKAIKLADWRQRFKTASGVDGDEKDTGTVRKAFDRARKRLIEARIVGAHEGFVWVN